MASSAEVGNVTQVLDDEEQATNTNVFESFQYKEILPGCQPHPGNIVESASLAAIEPPELLNKSEYAIPEDIIKSGKLSALQLEGMLYACQTHLTLLPSGSRRGFYIGDAAGVGKGRQIAGIIFDSFVRGRTKHIWFSISPDLIVDARRDMTDIGCHINIIEGCKQLDAETRAFGLPKEFKEGVVFSTYSTLVSSVKKGINTSQNRLDQLIAWCGGDAFEGCLIFDECHKAKHFVAKKEEASTKVALAVMAIQRQLPKARVVYCSATGVTDIRNMAYMERLGLWGDGCPFRSFDHFLETVEKKGLGVAEMMAMEMKAAGIYVSRGLSYQETEFWTVECRLTPEERQLYDAAAHVWHEVRTSLATAMVRTKSGGRNNRSWSQYWSAHQRFFKQLCMSLKVAEVAKITGRALEEGCCVVIGLQATGEASLGQDLGPDVRPGDSFATLFSLCREILKRFISIHFPVEIQGEVLEDDWCVEAKGLLLDFTDKLVLPATPLDDLIDRLGGPDCVAEMTGRKGRLVRSGQKGKFSFESRASSAQWGPTWAVDSLNVAERQAFMSGRKKIGIISDSASTGISLHADRCVANQRRRVHITLELPWSADKAVQQLGRSHRSNQVSGPIYQLVTTELGGERRFAAAVARRLEALGALTRGDRRAALCGDLSAFNLDTAYGRQALRTLCWSALRGVTAQGVQMEAVSVVGPMCVQLEGGVTEMHKIIRDCLEDMGLLTRDVATNDLVMSDSLTVGMFFNRLLGLPVQHQQAMFHYFLACIEAVTREAQREGRYADGMVDLVATSVRVAEPPKLVLQEFKASSLPTRLVTLEVDRGLPWERAQSLHSSGGKTSSFYRSRRELFGQRLILLAIPRAGQEGATSHVFRIARPNTGISGVEMDSSDLNSKYLAITDVDKAQTMWTEAYSRSSTECLHGSSCRSRAACTMGRRVYTIHLLTGSVIPFMSLLQRILLTRGPALQLARYEMTLRVMRVKLAASSQDVSVTTDRMVGVRFPGSLVADVEKLARTLKQAKARMGPQSQIKPDPDLLVPDGSMVWIQETQAPVNERFLRKALTAPPKITNFFKPTTATNAIQTPPLSSNLANRKAKLREETLIGPSPLPKRRSLVPSNESGSLDSKRPKKQQSSLTALFAKEREKTKKCPVCQIEFASKLSNGEINDHIDDCVIE